MNNSENVERESIRRMESEYAFDVRAQSGEIDVRDLARSIWRGKWFIFAATVISSIGAAVVALGMPNEYKATAILMPASTSSASSLSRMAGQFSGLAALAGVNIGGQNDNDKVVQAMELIKSWGVQEQFIRDNHLEVAVFAAKGWNRTDNKLIVDSDIYNPITKEWTRKARLEDGKTSEPNGFELYKRLSKRINITQDKKTDLITLSVEYYSPYMAKEWADQLVIAVNRNLQERDRVEAKKSIEYLQDKMNQTSLTEMKSVFSRLIEEQTKKLMLADVSDEYVLKALIPAKIPLEKSKPKRALICALGVVVGLFLSAFCWLFIEASRARKAEVGS